MTKMINSIVWELTEECDYQCPFCHRRRNGEKPLDFEQQKKIIMILAKNNVKRLCLSGGEPLQQSNIIDLIKFGYAQKIHIALNTSGGFSLTNDLKLSLRLTDEMLKQLEGCVDQILLSIRTLDPEAAQYLYGKEEASCLIEQFPSLVEKIVQKKIFLQVGTLVSRPTLSFIDPIGQMLVNLGPEKISWKLDQFYNNASLGVKIVDDYSLVPENWREVTAFIENKFKDKFRKLFFNDAQSRMNATDLMLTPQGNLTKSSNEQYEEMGSIFDEKLNLDFPTRRPLSSYDLIDRGWNDL